MSNYIPVPGHPRTLVRAHMECFDMVTLGYVGDHDSLIAAGIATAEMLAARERKGPRRPRVARDGDGYGIDRYYVVRHGQPVHRYRMRFLRNRQTALRFPGALEAIEVAELRDAAKEAEQGRPLSDRTRYVLGIDETDDSIVGRAPASSVTLH